MKEIAIAYGLFALYVLMLVTIGIYIKKKHYLDDKTIDEVIYMKCSVPSWLMTTSVFSAWIWVTSIIGSAEACVKYGVSGVVGYVLGAVIAFGIFIPIIYFLQKKMETSSVFLQFIGGRYSGFTKSVYYFFAVLAAIYITIEQAAGMSFVFNGFFGTSYKKIVFITMMIAIIYVIKFGMRGVIYSEFIHFFVIIFGFIILISFILYGIDFSKLSIGILDVQHNKSNPNYNPNVMHFIYIGGVKYFISAIIIALGQLLFDPGYYLKAYISKGKTDFMKAYVIGGILIWSPVAIISALVFGMLSMGQGIDFSRAINISVDISTKLLTQYYSSPVMILFAIVILCVGMSATIHYFIGIQGAFTVDFYETYIKKNGSDKDKILFGRTVLALLGAFCALIAISLEGISLLTIDMFSGIFFAAPCGALIMGIFSKKKQPFAPVLSIVLGLSIGFISWIFLFENRELGWFFGTILSFVTPFIYLNVTSFFAKEYFNFTKLKF